MANETKNRNETPQGMYTLHGPPGIHEKYYETWVEELIPDNFGTPSGFPQPFDAQDLNEGQSVFPHVSDYIYLGYYVD